MCRVEVVSREALIEPIIVHFSNGRLRPEATGDITFEVLQSMKQKHKLVVADTEHMTYKGTSVDGTDTNDRHYIAVLDKTRHKIKLVPTALFWMNPVLKDSECLAQKNVVDNSVNKENKQRKADELTMAFGSKKKKRAMESRLRHQVQNEELVSLMEKTATLLESSSVLEDSNPPNSVADLLPSVNRDATSLEQVYNLHDIISPDGLDSLSDAAAELVNATDDDVSSWESTKKYPQFVLRHLASLPIEEPSRSHKAKLLQFMGYLIYTANLKAAQVRVKDPYPAYIPATVKQTLLATFFQTPPDKRAKRVFPPNLKDKLTGHILVLGLLLDRFQLNVTDLQSDVKIAQTKLSILVRALGARLEMVDGAQWVKLKLPVAPFSETSRPMMKKKKK